MSNIYKKIEQVMDFGILDRSNSSTSVGLLHHQTKLDVFIIRAYNLLSNGAIINSNNLQSVTSSPRTANTTPSALSNSGSTLTANSKADKSNENPTDAPDRKDEEESMANNVPTASISLDASNKNTPSNNNEKNNENSNIIPSINNDGTETEIINIHSQYTQLFSKLSKLYSATLATGGIDEKSTSPKSAIELYQRFQQIIKELELSFEASPYSKYFYRLDEGLWQIKQDSELESDHLWCLVTMSIFSVYDPSSGKIMASNTRSRRVNNNTNSNTVSPIDSINSTSSIPNNKKPKKKYIRKKNQTNTRQSRQIGNKLDSNINSNNNTSNSNNNTSNSNSIHIDATNNVSNFMDAQILQKRLQSISQDVSGRSLNGYYTQPTSPGSGMNGDGFEFGLQNADMPQFNPPGNNAWKRRSIATMDVNTLDEDPVDEIFQLAQTNKGQRINNSTGNINNGINSSRYINQQNNVSQNIDIVSQQLKISYDALINEKDQRIVQLEKELELQRHETQWLRKMLIEDMGCVRSILQEIRK